MSDKNEKIIEELINLRNQLLEICSIDKKLRIFMPCITIIVEKIISEINTYYSDTDSYKIKTNSLYDIFASKQNVTNDYLFGLRACSSDLNLIKQKDYSQLIRLFKLAEDKSIAFVKDVEAFDDLVKKLETGELRIVKS